jgi:hypothetical protein
MISSRSWCVSSSAARPRKIDPSAEAPRYDQLREVSNCGQVDSRGLSFRKIQRPRAHAAANAGPRARAFVLFVCCACPAPRSHGRREKSFTPATHTAKVYWGRPLRCTLPLQLCAAVVSLYSALCGCVAIETRTNARSRKQPKETNGRGSLPHRREVALGGFHFALVRSHDARQGGGSATAMRALTGKWKERRLLCG